MIELEAALAADFAALFRADTQSRKEPPTDELLDSVEDEQEAAFPDSDRRGRSIEIDPEPCIGCIERVRCARQRLACRVFCLYVSHGGEDKWPEIPRNPSAKYFVRLFGKGARPRERQS